MNMTHTAYDADQRMTLDQEKYYRVNVDGDYVCFVPESRTRYTHSLHAALREFNRYCTPYYDHVTLEQDGPRGYETTLQTWCPSMFEGVQA